VSSTGVSPKVKDIGEGARHLPDPLLTGSVLSIIGVFLATARPCGKRPSAPTALMA
jgi:hypothetical protein